MGQKEPPRPGSTICYGQERARKSHQDPAVRFVAAKSGLERATQTLQYDLLRPRVGQKEPPKPGSTICYGQEWARKSHQDPAICYGQEWARKSHQDPAICYGQEWARKSHQDPAVRFVTAKSGPERATQTLQYDLLRPRVGQKEPPKPGSTICYGQEWARKSHQDPAICYGQKWARKSHQDPAICYGQEWARKSHQDPAVRFVTAKSGPERATKTRQYDLLRLRVGQKEPPRPGNTICYGQEWARKSHQDPAVRFVTAKSERQYDVLRPIVGQKEPPRPGSTICYS